MGIFKKTEKDIEIQRKDALNKLDIREKANQNIRQADAYDLATFLSKDELKFDWSSRRKRVDASLLLFGVLLIIMTIALLAAAVLERTIDQNYSSMFGGFYMFILFSFVTILGTYVFGSTFDSRSVRASATNMYASMMSARASTGAIAPAPSTDNRDKDDSTGDCDKDDDAEENPPKHTIKVLKRSNKRILKRSTASHEHDEAG